MTYNTLISFEIRALNSKRSFLLITEFAMGHFPVVSWLPH